MATMAAAPTFTAHPPAELFRRLGMYDTWAETDWRGNYMLSSQVWTTARDLARFGRLYLNDGVVDGERILPEGWRDYVSRPSGPTAARKTAGAGAADVVGARAAAAAVTAGPAAPAAGPRWS
jgi:CubicO group peptidase (beta-lactamase class C family)